ncbi:uncharacterized protein [Typha angustifolia]|uniref:uncharacterized protein n=1 Tax=Typha angustifolia TaxID=59011 RepID=UPI003C2E445D
MALRARDLHRLYFLLPEAIAPIHSVSRLTNPSSNGRGIRALTTDNTARGNEDFGGKSAYEVLGVSETSSAAEIKASFRKLAKVTHPDLAASSISHAAASGRFVQILAAYEILSDSQKRAHYDGYLFTQRRTTQKHPEPGSVMYTRSSSIVITRESNVVEWLKLYRLVIDDIIMKRKVATGSSYFDKLENELYSAIRAAYYGPLIESMDFLPDCFEAEERSVYETSELLHLVSGRDLFGIIYVADDVPELSHGFHEKLEPFDHIMRGVSQYPRHTMRQKASVPLGTVDIHEKDDKQNGNFQSDVYKDLELHLCGRVVATATRNPTCKCLDLPTADSEDHIHVFLTPNESVSHGPSQSCIHLGTITGLGSTGEEGSCSVYNGHGTETHVIMNHRTLMVKHMHWYQVGGEVSNCECRCSRARLPPSRYWLFEPRCYMHDVGGWYIETFGRDKKGKTVPSPRQWDGFIEHPEKRLHPAMYLLALAYRSLDLEEAKRRRWNVKNFFKSNLYYILHWCKKFF